MAGNENVSNIAGSSYFSAKLHGGTWKSQYSKEVSVNGFYVNQETNDLVVTSMDTAFKNFSLSRSNVVRGNITLVLVEADPAPALIEQLRAIAEEYAANGGTLFRRAFLTASVNIRGLSPAILEGAFEITPGITNEPSTTQ